MKIIIVGGVAAGASAAARLRRLDETAEILLIERGPSISYANCGLPYHVGGIIPDREDLLIISAQEFAQRFRIDVRTGHEVTAIHRAQKRVTLRDAEGVETDASYDKLILATGASPLLPPIPGLQQRRVLPLWSLQDMDRLMQQLTHQVHHVAIIGAGFIGMEASENLLKRGLSVTLIEAQDQVLPMLDKEMSSYLTKAFGTEKFTLKLSTTVTAISTPTEDAPLSLQLHTGDTLTADCVILCAGVRPNAALAKAAELALGPRGHILVNAQLQTSDPDIYAAGDVIEVNEPILGGKTAVPLAGPANKQGRIAADNCCGKTHTYVGSYGASVVKVGDFTVAAIGFTERTLVQRHQPFLKIYTHPASHAGYYPEGAQLHAKLLFTPAGKILGAQWVGKGNADKRLDVLAVALQADLTVEQLASLELAYAPPYNTAKDPVNFLGMIAQNMLAGETHMAYADALPPEAVILDVRSAAEVRRGTLPKAIHIPLETLRERLVTLPKDKLYITLCQVGVRGYIAERILRQHGFNVQNLAGGYVTWRAYHPED